MERARTSRRDLTPAANLGPRLCWPIPRHDVGCNITATTEACRRQFGSAAPHAESFESRFLIFIGHFDPKPGRNWHVVLILQTGRTSPQHPQATETSRSGTISRQTEVNAAAGAWQRAIRSRSQGSTNMKGQVRKASDLASDVAPTGYQPDRSLMSIIRNSLTCGFSQSAPADKCHDTGRPPGCGSRRDDQAAVRASLQRRVGLRRLRATPRAAAVADRVDSRRCRTRSRRPPQRRHGRVWSKCAAYAG